MHNGLDMITELKEKLNGFIQQEKGCDTKFQDEYEKLKKGIELVYFECLH